MENGLGAKAIKKIIKIARKKKNKEVKGWS